MVGETERRERFAYALQQAMDARKLSARRLAMDLGVDPRQVARWLQGKSLPNLYEAEGLVRMLRVREDLFRNPPPVPVPPAYPIGDYLLGAAESLVADAVSEGEAVGRHLARRPREVEVPSTPGPSRPRRPAAGH